MKLLVLAGEKCAAIMGGLIVNVPVKDVECDEIWGFVQKKEGHKSHFHRRFAPCEGEGRYSPAEVTNTEVVPVMGRPDPSRICTSIVERQNLTIRMQMRRLTRLTNAFSKKWDNLWSAYCLHFAYYNFCRIHRSIRVTPAMESGLTDHVWELAELLA